MLKVIILVIFILILIAAYLNYENNYLSISHYVVNNDKLPESFDGFIIVQISDLHNVKNSYLNKTLIEKVKEIKPDIIAITGDLIDSSRTDIEQSISVLREIKDVAPIHYVSGNHEVSSEKRYKPLREEMEKLGVNILRNDEVDFYKGEECIEIIGVEDPRYIFNGTQSIAQIVEGEILDVSYDREKFILLLSHRPDLIDVYAETGMDLVLTGHAHGGQIRLPFIGGLFVPNQGWFPKYTSGEHTKDGTTVIISRGIGNSRFPFRINNRPELVVVELKTK